MMRRREFVGLLGSAVAWPSVVLGQQRERARRIGVLINFAPDDSAAQSRLIAFLQELKPLGWTEGRNVRIDIRWGSGDATTIRRHAAELVELGSEVILAVGSPAAGPLLQATRTVPIVFVLVSDPVGAGLVETLAHPGGNATGFANFEFGMAGKWLELLKDIAPALKRAAVIRDADTPAGAGQFGAIQAVAATLGFEVSAINARETADVERALANVGRSASAGVIVTAGGWASNRRDPIIKLLAQHRLPAVYPDEQFVREGGLIAYGPDRTEQFRLAAGYVDRILKGDKPANLPVQLPTKYAMAINLKTTKALGIEVPPMLLVRADEVIE
jgi:putative ABC transport system substrate-binding protein